jgi:hypothetical protein
MDGRDGGEGGGQDLTTLLAELGTAIATLCDESGVRG